MKSDFKRWRKAQIHEKDFQFRRESIKFGPSKGVWAHKYVRLLESYTAINNRAKILDVGCGSDAMVSCMVRGERIGLDPLIDFFCGASDLSRKISWLKGIGEYIPFKNECFDIILCMNVLDHMYDPFKALGEMSRVLKSDGIFMLYVACHSQVIKYFRRVKEKMKMGDVFHPFSFSAKEILGTMSELNLHIVYLGREPTNWSKRILISCKKKHVTGVVGVTMRTILSLLWKKLANNRRFMNDDGNFIFVAHKMRTR